jgi:hypothetical protein
VKDLLVIQTAKAVDILDPKTFERRHRFELSSDARHRNAHRHFCGSLKVSNNVITPHGLYVDGLLYDFDLELKSILAPKGVLFMADQGVLSPEIVETMLGRLRAADNRRYRDHYDEQYVVNRLMLPETDRRLELTYKSEFSGHDGEFGAMRYKVEMAVGVRGEVTDERVLIRRTVTDPNQAMTKAHPNRILFRPDTGEVFVTIQKDMYKWTAPMATGRIDADAPSWDMKQSHRALSDGEATTLRHTVEGGKAPFVYDLVRPCEGVSIDKNSGVVTLDNARIVELAAETVAQQYGRHIEGMSPMDVLRRGFPEFGKGVGSLLGRKANGAPVLLPIRVDVSDNNLKRCPIRYFVVVETPLEKVAERMKRLADARRKEIERRREAMERQRERMLRNRNPNGIDEDLERRIDALEQRVDMLTRQVNLLVKELKRERTKEQK